MSRRERNVVVTGVGNFRCDSGRRGSGPSEAHQYRVQKEDRAIMLRPPSDPGPRLTLGTPATYRICVQGELAASWSERLGGLQITTHRRQDQTLVTTLVGVVRDQAELIGIVNSLYDLHLPLLSVQMLRRA